MEQRTDQHTEQLIDTAIRMSVLEGYTSAARHLAEHGIPLRVIIRVLIHPGQRRDMSVEL
jgi:hypothetical protein